jgi:phospholipase C
MVGFVIVRSRDNDSYSIWAFDPEGTEVLTRASAFGGQMDRSQELLQLGGYLLAWGPARRTGSGSLDFEYPYRLLPWDPGNSDPLNVTPLKSGAWKMEKFFPYPGVYSFRPDQERLLELLPFTNFLMSYIPATGRGTYALWNFDPDPAGAADGDPIPSEYMAQNAFQTIQAGHELHPVANYALDRNILSGELRLWSFDPQDDVPLSYPEVAAQLPAIDPAQPLTVVGDYLLAWNPSDLGYRLWHVDPTAPAPLGEPVRTGTLPDGFDGSSTLMGFQPRIPVEAAVTGTPGTLDFMRQRIKHVVFYMLESRSFDSVLGWLYETGNPGIHFVGSDRPFDGASASNYNEANGLRFPQTKYNGGAPTSGDTLNVPAVDAFHGYADSLMQLFNGSQPGYAGRETPNMGGFVKNTVNPEVMDALTPLQLGIVNGLADAFAVSDEWFCSIPAGTDVNRAFSVGGSAENLLYTYEMGNRYEYFPTTPRRPSLWKVLYSYGITDWKIYWAMCWQNFVFTYHLYLKGQIPSVDAVVTNQGTQYVTKIENFFTDARAGTLPAFSFLEPIWFNPDGVTTSYHPSTDVIPGEIQLNRLYQALSQGENTKWEDTLFFITFSKNGGLYDHVPPPYAQKPWPKDRVDAFEFDLLGPRVPAIVVSPWIKEHTVFRSRGPIPFDSTSFMATLLEWFGIPRAQWRLGDRVAKAPTFETALDSAEPRAAPVLSMPVQAPGSGGGSVPTDCDP